MEFGEHCMAYAFLRDFDRGVWLRPQKQWPSAAAKGRYGSASWTRAGYNSTFDLLCDGFNQSINSPSYKTVQLERTKTEKLKLAFSKENRCEITSSYWLRGCRVSSLHGKPVTGVRYSAYPEQHCRTPTLRFVDLVKGLSLNNSTVWLV